MALGTSPAEIGLPATLNRRSLVAALAGGLSAFAARFGVWSIGLNHPEVLPFEALGRAYHALGGTQSRARAFLDHVLRRSMASGQAPGEVIAELRSADFAAGNTLVLDGWVVAEAEALWCAGLSMRRMRQA
jgi:hypothetical protein